MAKFVTLRAILQKLVEAARNKPESTGKLVTFILKNEKKIKPLVKATAGAAADVFAATEVLKKVNDATGDTMNKVDKFVFDNASKAISILQDATSITNLLTGGKTESGAGKVFRQIEKFVNPGQIMLEQVKGKINMANKIRNKLFGPNDLAWYSHYPELNNAMIGPSFYNIVGTPMKMNGPDSTKYSVPLGMSLDIALTVPTLADKVTISPQGPTQQDASTWLNAINKIYASIRRANSGAINYSPRELNAFILNFRSLVAEYVQWGRLYGTIIKYKIINRAVPDLFFRMIGVAQQYISEYTNQAANIFNKLTQWRLKLNSLCPIDLDLFKRTEWLFTGYWKDDSSAKAQYFAFKSYYLPKFTGEESSNITEEAMSGGFALSYNDAVRNMEDDITNFASDPINVIIAGDMLKAFADAGLKQYTLPKYSMDYEAPEAYDEEALTIIQNASTMPMENPNIYLKWADYDKGILVTECFSTNEATNPFVTENAELMSRRFINAYAKDKTKINDSKMILAITRLSTTYYAKKLASGQLVMAEAIGTEIAVRAHYYYIDGHRTIRKVTYYDYEVIDCAEDPSPLFMLNYCWAGTDWSPLLRPAVKMNVSESLATLSPLPLWDWEMYGEVTTAQMASYNDIVTMNLLYVPDVIKPNKVELLINMGKDKSNRNSNKSNKQNKNKNNNNKDKDKGDQK